MYKIKIFSSFCDSASCKTNYEKVFRSNLFDFYGEDSWLFITNNNDYTHAIILNTAMPPLTIPKENVIGLAFEPIEILGLTEEFVEYAKKHIGKYLIGSKYDLPEPFIEHFSFMWHNNPMREIIYKHSKNIMSIVVSEKNVAPGHNYRHLLVNNIIHNNLPIDIYGRGANNYLTRLEQDANLCKERNENIKGEFNDNEPYKDYYFSICIENFQSNDYFSEKIMDPLLHNCMPIYLGAKNIANYFEDVIILSGDLIMDLNMIYNILQNPETHYKRTYRKKNYKKISFFENIVDFFD